MDDKQKNEEGKKEEPVKPEDAGVQSKTVSELDRADAIAERQKRENDRREQLIDREESLHARKMVGGQSEAGSNQAPTFSDEEKASRARIKAVADASGSSWGKKYE